jgi:hypothetical protein
VNGPYAWVVQPGAPVATWMRPEMPDIWKHIKHIARSEKPPSYSYFKRYFNRLDGDKPMDEMRFNVPYFQTPIYAWQNIISTHSYRHEWKTTDYIYIRIIYTHAL